MTDGTVRPICRPPSCGPVFVPEVVVRFRYFDPLQQATVEGDLGGAAEVSDLVTTVQALRSQCPPALEFAAADGTSLVLGVAEDRAVILWTDPGGTTSHSVGDSSG